MRNLGQSLVRGVAWTTIGHFLSLVIVLVTNIWIANILSPVEFGQIGIIMFFISIASVLTESGLGGALIRKNDANSDDYSTVFLLNLILSITCYLLLVIFSDSIARFYNDSEIVNLLRVAGLLLFINAFQVTQNAKMISDLRFREKSIYRLIAVLTGSVCGVLAVYYDFGVWSLVIIQLLTAGTLTILMWVKEGFFFSLRFNRRSFKELYSFGVNTTVASILNTAFDNIYQLVLAKFFSISQAGFFYQTKRIQDVPNGIMTQITQGVLFSSLAKLQDNENEFMKFYNRVTSFLSVGVGLLMLLLFIYAENIIIILFNDEWLGATFFMQYLSVATFFFVLENINKVIFKVFNLTRRILYLELLKKIVQVITIIFGIYTRDISILIFGFILTNLIGYCMSYFYSRKSIEIKSYFEIVVTMSIVLVAILSVIATNLMSDILNLSGLDTFYLMPFVVFLYFVFLYVFRAFNIVGELKLIRKHF